MNRWIFADGFLFMLNLPRVFEFHRGFDECYDSYSPMAPNYGRDLIVSNMESILLKDSVALSVDQTVESI